MSVMAVIPAVKIAVDIRNFLVCILKKRCSILFNEVFYGSINGKAYRCNCQYQCTEREFCFKNCVQFNSSYYSNCYYCYHLEWEVYVFSVVFMFLCFVIFFVQYFLLFFLYIVFHVASSVKYCSGFYCELVCCYFPGYFSCCEQSCYFCCEYFAVYFS